MTISERMTELLNQQGKTQVDLAKSIGASPSSVNYWVKKNSDIPSSAIIGIAEYLNVTPFFLLTGEEEPEPEQIVERVEIPVGEKLTEEESELVRIYRNLDREGRTMVLATAYQHRARMMTGGDRTGEARLA